MKKSKQVKTLLFSKINYSFILLFLFLFANPQISFSQYNSTLEEKTITGYVINSFGEPWHNQIAELYEGENLTATDTIKNGYFTFENINIVSVNDFTEVNSFSLEQNYPNPFNPSTIINYSINKPQNISLVIYDILGRKVKTLFKGYSSSGTFRLGIETKTELAKETAKIIGTIGTGMMLMGTTPTTNSFANKEVRQKNTQIELVKQNYEENKQTEFKKINDLKTLQAYIEDENGVAWNTPHIGTLYERIQGYWMQVGQDTIREGQLNIENIITGIIDDNPNPITTKEFLLQSYPNPFGDQMVIPYKIDELSDVILEIYDIKGSKIKTLVNKKQEKGIYEEIWDGTNNNGEEVAQGVYFYRLEKKDKTGKKENKTKKAIQLDGAGSSNGGGTTTEDFMAADKRNNSQVNTTTILGKVNNDSNRLRSVDTQNVAKATQLGKINNNSYTLRLTGPDMQTTDIENVDMSGTSPINLGTIIAHTKTNLITLTGFVYDIDTKYDEEGNRLTPQGIDSMKVYLQTNPEGFVYTDENGMFNIGLDSIPGNIVDTTGKMPSGAPYHMAIKDTLIITGKTPEDTTYYLFKTPVHKHVTINNFVYRIDNEVKEGKNIMTAFNDTTGIPMIKRWRDQRNGVDFLEHLKYVTNMENLAKEDPIWEGIILRIKDSNLPIKVYMNRENDPTDGWYADSSLVGLQAMQTGRFRFEETTDTAQALLFMKYDNDMVGQGLNKEFQEDEQGIHLTHYEISIRGPSGGSTLGYYTPMLVAHEALHIVFGGGNHSPYEQDMFYLDPLTRKDDGYPLATTEREKKGIRLLYNLERNPKLGQYGRWINSRNLLSQQYLFCKISKMSFRTRFMDEKSFEFGKISHPAMRDSKWHNALFLFCRNSNISSEKWACL